MEFLKDTRVSGAVTLGRPPEEEVGREGSESGGYESKNEEGGPGRP